MGPKGQTQRKKSKKERETMCFPSPVRLFSSEIYFSLFFAGGHCVPKSQ